MNEGFKYQTEAPKTGCRAAPIQAAYLRKCAESLVGTGLFRGRGPMVPFTTPAKPAEVMLAPSDQPIAVAIIQHLGLCRENQEDAAVLVHLQSRVLNQEMDFHVGVLADGCGGMSGGEVASGIACSRIEASLVADLCRPEACQNAISVEQTVIPALRTAFAAANRGILERAVDEPVLRHMASTAVCVVVVGSCAYVAWAGDSRLTICRGDSILHITRDHNRAQILVDAGIITPDEAAAHPGKSHLTNALGIHDDDEPIPELATWRLQPADLLVLSSDGFHEGLTDDTIARLCVAHLTPPVTTEALRVLARTMETESLAGYGGDNLTAILMYVQSVPRFSD